MEYPTIKELLEAGVHFGHQVKRWHPKMKPYIFMEREGIHVIDLDQTSVALAKGAQYLKELASRGGKIVFVATKEQAQEIVKDEATRAGALFVTKRWVGGTLTNFDSLKGSLSRMGDLERQKEAGELKKYTKKERLLMDRDIAKLKVSVGGLSGLDKIPDALFIVDTKKETNAVREGQKTGVTIVGIVDTNCDPTGIDYVIPGNDDAIKSIKLLVKTIADAVKEGYDSFNKENPSQAVKEATNG